MLSLLLLLTKYTAYFSRPSLEEVKRLGSTRKQFICWYLLYIENKPKKKEENSLAQRKTARNIINF